MPRFASVHEERDRRVPQETSWSMIARIDFSSTLGRAMAAAGRGNNFGCACPCCGSAGSRGADCCAKVGDTANHKQILAAMLVPRSLRFVEMRSVIGCPPRKECFQQSGILAQVRSRHETAR